MNKVQLIGDNLFEGGFSLQTVPLDGEVVLDFGFPTRKTAVWKIAQHFSRFDLTKNATFSVLDNGARVYENEGKRITLTQDEQNAWVISLETFCSAEYDRARKAGEDWPHLLIEQDMHGEYIERYEALYLTMSIKNDYISNCMAADYDPTLHCFQCSLFFAIQNENPSSAGFDDFIWFGIPAYDSRCEYKDLYIAEDGGKDDASHKLIYCLGGREWYDSYYDCNPKDGEWATVKVDILPFIYEAVKSAHQQQYLTHTKLSDLKFNSMNLGIEAPGTFDGGLSIKNLSLEGVLRSENA